MKKFNLYFEKSGCGYPLIMLHGNGEDHTSLDALADKLKANFTIYLIDSRGHGKSPGPVADSYDIMADDLLAFLKIHKLDHTHIFGYSDGAIVALKALLKAPQQFTKLVLCGLNISPDGLADDLFSSMTKSYQKEKSPLLKLMLEGPVFNDYDLLKVNHSILLYFGEHDVIKIEHQLMIKQRLHHAKHIILPNHTHESYILHNDMLKDDIKSFLEN